MTQPILVVCGWISRHGKILVAKRPDRTHLPGRWEFPGGKVEPGETDSQALVRELHEELGIVATVGAELARHLHHYPVQERELGEAKGATTLTVDLRLLSVVAFEGEPNALFASQIAWVGTDWLKEHAHEFPEADVPLMQKLI